MNGRFDRLVAAACPAPYTERLGGWRLRYAAGVTKRANSVLPLGDPGDLRAAIDGAESFYAARDLPAVFSIGDGALPGLDGALGARGYAVADPTLVMTAELRGHPDELGAADVDGHPVASIDDTPLSTWFDLWWSVDGRYPDRRDTAIRSTGLRSTGLSQKWRRPPSWWPSSLIEPGFVPPGLLCRRPPPYVSRARAGRTAGPP